MNKYTEESKQVERISVDKNSTVIYQLHFTSTFPLLTFTPGAVQMNEKSEVEAVKNSHTD